MHDFLLGASSTIGINGWMSKTIELSTYTSTGQGIALDSAENIYIIGKSNDNIALLKYDTTGALVWDRTLSVGTDAGYGIVIDSSDNIYITGANSTNSIFYSKYSTAGAIVWQKQLDVATVTDVGYGITSDSSGNIYIIGAIADTASTSYTLLTKASSAGTVLWQCALGAPAVADRSYAVKLDSLENIYVAVNSSSSTNLIKLDTNGNLLWQQQLTGTVPITNAIDIDSLDNVYLTGNYGGALTSFIAKYDSLGNIQWEKSLDTSSVNDITNCIAIDNFDNIYIGGQSNNTTSSYMTIYRYNTSGTCIWQRKLQIASTIGMVNGIVCNAIGDIFITGYFSGTSWIFTAKLKADGYGLGRYTLDANIITYAQTSLVDSVATLTSSISTLPVHKLTDLLLYIKAVGTTYNLYDIVQDSSNNIYVAYSTPGMTVMSISKFDSTGTLLWGKSDPKTGTSNVGGISLLLDSAQNIYIVGQQYEGVSDTNAGSGLIFKYSPTGTSLAQMRYDNGLTSSYEFISNAVIDASDNIYITGQLQSSIAYFAKVNSTTLFTSIQGLLDTTTSADISNAIAVDNSGNVYIAGQANFTTATASYAFIAKFDSSGVLQWQKKIDATGADMATAIILDANANIYIAGQTAGGNSFVAKFDNTGTNVWQKILNYTAATDAAVCIALDASDNIYIGGQMNSVAYIAKYDNNGNLLWTRQTNGTVIKKIKIYSNAIFLIDGIYGVMKLNSQADINVVASDTFGYIPTTSLVDSVATFNFSDADMTQLQAKYCIETGGHGTSAVDSSENVYTCFAAASPTYYQTNISKFNKDKELLWSYGVNTLNVNCFPASINIDASGNVYLTVLSYNINYGHFGIIKLNASGVFQWKKFYTYNSQACFYTASSMTFDSTGNLIVLTTTNYNNNRQHCLFKISAAGDLLWNKDIKSAASFWGPSKVIVDSSDNIYIGVSRNSGSQISSYFCLFKLDSSGNQLILKYYNAYGDTFNDNVRDMVLDSSGNLFVLISCGTGNGDYMAVLYKFNSSLVNQWYIPVSMSSGTYGSGGKIFVSTANDIYYTVTNVTSLYTHIIKANSEGVTQQISSIYSGSGLLTEYLNIINDSMYIGSGSVLLQIPGDGTILGTGVYPLGYTHQTTSTITVGTKVLNAAEFANPPYLSSISTGLGAEGTVTSANLTPVNTVAFQSILGIGSFSENRTITNLGLAYTTTKLDPTVPATAASMAEATPVLTTTTITT